MKNTRENLSQHDILDIIYKAHKESDTAVTKKSLYEFYDEFTSTMLSLLGEGKEVTLNGIMKFELVDKKPRIARNPQTGESVEVPAKTVVKVRNRKALYELTKTH